MAKIPCGIRIPEAVIDEVADLLWHGTRPTDPPLVAAKPEANPPVVEVPAPPLTDQECVNRWIKREVIGRFKQHRVELAEKAAAAALDTSIADQIN